MSESTILHQSRWFSIRADAEGTEYLASSGNEVLVVPLTEGGEVILISEPAPAFGEPALIVPTGETSPNLTHAETANRELQEEIGYRSDDLVSLGELRPWSKYLAVRSYVYLARKLTPARLPGDEDYEISMERVPLHTFEALIEDGRLTDARVIAALYLTRRFLASSSGRPVTDESYIAEWCRRLDRLTVEGHETEVAQLHRAMEIALGGRSGERALPLDLRLHGRLAEIYARINRPAQAIEQLRLAVELAPRDLVLLHRLGLAYLEDGQPEACWQVLEQMEDLDAAVMTWNADCAGLKARWLREAAVGDRRREYLQAARDTYEQAMKYNPLSYYMADGAAQVSLLLGDLERAKADFAASSAAIKRLPKQSLWSLAAATTAAIAGGDEEGVVSHLRAIHDRAPDPRALATIERSLREVHAALGLPAERLGEWLAILQGEYYSRATAT